MTQKQEVERPNWVQARADCTLEGTFEQLVNAIKADVRAFNTLPEQKRKDQVMHIQTYVHTVRFGYGEPADLHRNDHIKVHFTGTAIQVFRDQAPMFEVEPRWNERTLTCDLLINGEVHSLWQISQKAIGDLLFG